MNNILINLRGAFLDSFPETDDIRFSKKNLIPI